ncbi:ABC transporter ATP-binding protein [Staphylococcus equorum]|uniref:ABC transporter ATP-binding protein n=1 Tax=Staphylococcus equorum TaxID=246432 RepID=A0A9X4LB40_9STAP|nr:ABC transporter ATP-binding protein [Staphylococcus equorum]MDG0843979.1 ABC transporter ATP-binding protein [Staphylococcus equorum]MDG0860270.1 ABC transporter ATP-binding protein [Staphylococcus equorum]
MISQIRNLEKKIDNNKIINNISFNLEEGSINAILGPNGVGKTTTIRLLTGLLQLTKGEIQVLGTNTKSQNFDKVRQNIGVQNDGNLYEALTIYENLKIWANFYNISKKNREQKIQELLKYFNLSDRKNSKVGTLSKGMKQKVSIIRALVHSPKLLILDEPTSGLDPSASVLLINYLQKIVKEENVTVFMCTHQLQGLEEIADNIFIMYDGKFIASGDSNTLLNEAWPGYEFAIYTNNYQKSLERLKGFYHVIDENKDKKTIKIHLNQYADISKAIHTLIEYDIEVYTVTEIKHSIKELYFQKIREAEFCEL